MQLLSDLHKLRSVYLYINGSNNNNMIGIRVHAVYEQAVIGMIAPNDHHRRLLLPVGIHVSFTPVLFAPTYTVTQVARKTRATCIMRSYIARPSQRLMLAIFSCIATRLPLVLYSYGNRCKNALLRRPQTSATPRWQYGDIRSMLALPS